MTTSSGSPLDRVRANVARLVTIVAIAFALLALALPAVALTLVGVLTIVAVVALLATGVHALVQRIQPTAGSAFERRPVTVDPVAVPPTLQSFMTLASVNPRAEMPGTIRHRIRDVADVRLRAHHALDLRNPDDQAAVDRLLSPLMHAALARGADAPRLTAESLPRLLDDLEQL